MEILLIFSMFLKNSISSLFWKLWEICYRKSLKYGNEGSLLNFLFTKATFSKSNMKPLNTSDENEGDLALIFFINTWLHKMYSAFIKVESCLLPFTCFIRSEMWIPCLSCSVIKRYMFLVNRYSKIRRF